jgi:hypothetical protein
MSIVQLAGEWGMYFTWNDIVLKDFLFGFFIALALRRGRIAQLLNKLTPTNTDKDTPTKNTE